VSAAVNPYAAPTARVEDQDTEAERIRREHIGHESSIKAVGLLYYLVGGVFVLLAITSLFVARVTDGALVVLFFLAIGGIQVAVGWGLRALRPWGRVVGAILSVLGLLGFPIGTLINGYILWLYFSKKGNAIFAPEYKAIIAATPQVKYGSSIIVWILIALVLAFVVIGVGVFIIDGR